MGPPEPPKDTGRQAWLEWRIAWLEWCVGGVNRGFNRPVQDNAQGVGKSTPYTTVSTAFGQPMAEDTELWARVAGRMRPRRQRAQTASGFGLDLAASSRFAKSTGKLPEV